VRIASLLVALLAALASPARGDGSSEAQARGAYAQGVEAFGQQKYDVAELSFLRVYDLTHSPEVLYDLAVVLEKQHRWGEAAERYQAYLRDSIRVRDQARIRARIADLVGRQKRQDEMDRAMNEGRAAPSEVAQAPGNQVLALDEAELRPPDATPPPEPVRTAPVQQPLVERPAAAPHWWRRWWFWTAVGAVVAAAAVVTIAVVATRGAGESPTTFHDIGPGAPLVRF
jgi:hypothetical protein